MGFYRLKHSFTAGELTPLMETRVDFERYKNGCRSLKNMVCATQGPAVRRPGFKFVFDLMTIGLDPANPIVRMIPFVFNELQAYVMIFYMHTDGSPRVVFATTAANGEDGLVVYGNPPIAECPPGTPVTPTTGEIVTLTLPPTWDIEAFDWAQSGDEMYFAQPELAPHIIQRYDHECWALSIVTFTNQPADWSTQNGWPERVTFHQQRLAFAANKLRRQTVWMTQAGDFSSFVVNSPIVDSDAVTFTLDSGTQNKIQWMTSSKSLHIGTLGNEWTVTGNNRDALTPENILAKRQTNSGSEPNKPLLVGLTTLFIERHGRSVNEFVYDYTYDSYKTSDMSILAPHLTKDYSIVDWTYQQTPDSVIWCVREDGVMLGITYQRQHQVVGWHRHPTEGKFKTVSAIPGVTREDDVWVVTSRVVDGADKYYVEILEDFFNSDDAVDARFLDSYSLYDGPPTSIITGARHLRNLIVDVLADGTVHPPVLVDFDGSFTLNNEYSTVVVGLPFASEVRPLLGEVTTDHPGTSLGRRQRITEVGISLYKTLGMYVGRYGDDGEEIAEEKPFRVPADLLGSAVPLFTGWYRVDFPEGFNYESDYFIRQLQPLPMIVLGVVDDVEVYEL